MQAKLDSKFNEQQLEVIKSQADKLLVLAGAGTGKTTVMIARILRLVNVCGVKPDKILALTFTNAAAREMESRYTSQSDKKLTSTPAFSTFHAFCYHVLSTNYRVRKEIGYEDIPEITDESEIQNLQRDVREKLKLKLSMPKLLSDGKLLSYSEKLEHKMFWEYYKQQLRRKNIISFDLLVHAVSKLFIDKSPLVQEYIDRYEYVFVDEFQDTDPLQWEFVQCFDKSKLFVVGDACQAIYTFRNADSSIIKGLSMNKGWTTVKLIKNYRSTKDIIELANRNSRHMEDAYRVLLETDKLGSPVVFTADTRIEYRDRIPQSILSKVSRFCTEREGTSAILLRTNREVTEVMEYLYNNEIPYNTSESNLEYDKLIRCAYDKEYRLEYYLSKLSYKDFVNFHRDEILDCIDVTNTEERLQRFYKNKYHNKDLEHIMNAVDQISLILLSDLEPFEKATAVYDILDLKCMSIELQEEESNETLIRKLTEIVNKQQKSELYVGTIHSSKGLEYDTVVLLGVNGPTFQLVSEEDKNLYYVGITRARKDLMVVSA